MESSSTSSPSSETPSSATEEYEYYDDAVHLSDFWNELTKTNSIEDPTTLWLSLLSKPDTTIECKFREYWRIAVPRLLAPTHGKTTVDQKYEVNRIQAALLDPLDAYICGVTSSSDINEVYTALSVNDTPPALCGHTFRYGDPVYSCKDCGQDATCVLCSECFQQSEHKKHHYRMQTSGGGGYCDCGDSEAFLQHPLCAKHEALDVQKSTSAQVMETMPEEVKSRAKDLMSAICKYCFLVMSEKRKITELHVGKKEKETWTELAYCFDHSNYCLVLKNDYYHTYPEVIMTLKNSVTPRLSEKQIQSLTEVVDKEGRAIIKVGAFQDCAAIRDKMSGSTPHEDKPLNTVILPSYTVAHQYFAIQLLEWLVKLFGKCSGFRALFAEVAFSTSVDCGIKLDGKIRTVAESILIHDAKIWKLARKAWITVVIEGVLKEYDSKVHFARLFIRNYGAILCDFINDDQEMETTVTNLTVQIFTVKSIAHILIEEENAFFFIMTFFRNQMEEHVDANGVLCLETWMEDEKSEFARIRTVLTDLCYLLKVPLERNQFNPKITANFYKGLEEFVKSLSYLQEIDPHRRETGNHVEFDSGEGRYVEKLIVYTDSIATMIQKWCAKDKGLLIQTINLIAKECDNHLKKKPTLQTKSITVYNVLYEIPVKNILSEKVSNTVPFQRFLAELLPVFNEFPKEFSCRLKSRLENIGDILAMVDPTVTAVSTLASISVGLWKRNGFLAMSQAHIYNHGRLLPGSKRLDLYLLQTVACLLDDPGLLVMVLLQRHQVLSWFNNSDIRGVDQGNKNVTIADVNRLAEQCLNLILAMVMERQTHNIGLVSERDELKHRMIQLLCVEPTSHSAVIDKLAIYEKDNKLVDEILKEISELKQSTKNTSRLVLTLKEEYLSSFNPFYYFYTQEQASLAYETQLSAKKKRKEKLFFAIPRLPKLAPVHERLPKITSSVPVVKLIEVVLKRAGKANSSFELVTSKQVHYVCMLVIQGYQDDISANETEFADMAERINLIGLITDVAQNYKDPELQDVIDYTLERANDSRELILNLESRKKEGSKTSPSREGGSVGDEEEMARKRRAAAAASRRNKILAQMNAMQNKFAAENAQDLKGVNVDSGPTDSCPMDTRESGAGRTVAVGIRRSPSKMPDSRYTCIMCQEEQSLSSEDTQDAILVACHVKNTTVLSQVRNRSSPGNNTCSEEHLESHLDLGPGVQSCGHAMHSKCYQKFFDSLIVKERERTRQNGPFRAILNYDIQLHEYLCPICERLCNNVLPLMPPVFKIFEQAEPDTYSTFALWHDKMVRVAKDKTLDEAKGVKFEKSSSTLPRIVIQSFRDNKKKAQLSVKVAQKPSEQMLVMANVFAVNMFTKSMNLQPSESDFRNLQLLFQSCSMALHLSQAGIDNSPDFMEEMTSRDEDALRALVRLSITYPILNANPTLKRLNEDVHPMFKYLLCNALHVFSILLLDDQKTTFYELDSLYALVLLTVATPTLVNTVEGRNFILGHQDHFILQLCLAQNVAQIIIGFEALAPPESACKEEVETRRMPTCSEAENKLLRRLWKQSCELTGRSPIDIPENFGHQVKYKVRRFLRCACLFFHYYTDVPLPSDATSYDDLCHYLGLNPDLSVLLKTKGLQEIMESFVSNESLGRLVVVSLPPRVRTLIDLPEDYSNLLDQAAKFKCPNNVLKECRNPALCLVCGVIVCSESQCCQELIGELLCGACTVHARKCGGDAGLFLRFRHCDVMMLTDIKRAHATSAPFVDEYGEPDTNLRRGNPLKLNAILYNELNKAWVTNGIPDKVSRSFNPNLVFVRARSPSWYTL